MSLQFDGERVYEHIRRISAEIGARMMGTEQEKQAADYIRSHLNALGLEVKEQRFDVESTSLVSHKVEIVEPDLGEIPSWPILLTPDTTGQGLTGELVIVEGVDESHVGPHLAGRIVLWLVSRRMEFWTKYRALASYRPLAILVVWPTLGVQAKHLHICETMARPYERVTSFCIAYEDAMRIVKAKAKQARVNLHSIRRVGASRNVIGQQKGSTYPDEIVVVGAHYDSVLDVPGAVDNASGVAAVLELARLFAQRGSGRTIRFVAWGAEEGGMLGSWCYVRKLKQQEQPNKQELECHLLCISLDALGMTLGQNVCYVAAPPQVSETVADIGKELGIPHQVKEEYYGSDSEVFVWAGVPAVSFAREGLAFGYLHTPKDTIDLIDRNQLQRNGTFVDAFLERTANAGVWPFSRSIPEKLSRNVVETLSEIGWIQS